MTASAHYSIHHQLFDLPHLTPGKRRRHIKGVLLLVHGGSGLLQLGRQHFPLTTGEAAFLPAGTLFAWHALAGSRVSHFAFSCRLPQPAQAGRLHPSALLAAIAGRLAGWQGEQAWQGPYGRLCRALHDELPAQPLLPFESMDPLTARIAADPAGFTLEDGEQQAFRDRFGCDAASWRRQYALLQVLRELPRAADPDALTRAHGFASFPQFEQDCRHWLGSPCHTGDKNG
ncbi:AraC family ligand binding domain-containing protein [Oceanimonas pelagia]|uniref:AraC family ligand binding domain-containing protein n=1 Tax=Oceanimonas pelagia TaxID=3028314 RepID=A0AA50KMW9_9GAMM|nr:AraC family ligand binding domain-containing protein [Oceanimonas pelagia]WMC09942.1 AraC family ligand binding domain-containing protein [Oceanimonas pelagia]